MLIPAVILASFIPIPGLPDVGQMIKIGEAVKVLRDIEKVLDTIGGHAGRIQDILGVVYPDNVVQKLIGGHIKSADPLIKVVRAMACPWKFSFRVKGLQRIYNGARICRDEWERIMGPPTALAGADLEEFWDFESVNRMNLVSDRIKAGEEHQKTSDFLMKSAVLGAAADQAVQAATGGSPGFAQRVAAMASAHQGAIAAEMGDTQLAMLQLDSQRVMRKQKQRRDEVVVALAVYDGLARPRQQVTLPPDLLLPMGERQ